MFVAILRLTFPLADVATADKNEPERSEGSSAGAMWVSGMSGASAANPDEGAEQCEATEELLACC